MKINRHQKIVLALQIIFLFLLPTVAFFVGVFKLSGWIQIFVAVLYMLVVAGLLIYLTVNLLSSYLRRAIVAKRSLNYYIQEEIGQYEIGSIIFLNNGKIIWASDFIKKRFGDNVLNKTIKELFLVDEWNDDNLDFNFQVDKYDYQVHVSFEHNIVTIRDITIQTNLLEDYKRQRIVFGELSIDNMNMYRAILSQEDMFKFYGQVINMLDELSRKFNLTYRQYENGRFFLITNQETLNLWEKQQFTFFNSFKGKQTVRNIDITFSVGFSYGNFKYDSLEQLAKDALMQSQTRGGDQITVMTRDEKPRHYGSTSEIDVNLSRTNTNYIAKMLLAKIRSKLIDKVIIYGHKDADLDALGSTFGVCTLARALGKEAYIQNKTFDETTRHVFESLSAEHQSWFISVKEANVLTDEKSLVVICDTFDQSRIENEEAFKNVKKENIIVLDHHRISINPEFAFRENLYIDSSASSASEIVTEIIALTSNSDKIDSQCAQLLLNGIYLDTNNFQKQVTAKTFSAASLLQEWGAKIIEAVSLLKMREDVFETIRDLLQNLQEVKKGYYLAFKDEEVATDIISKAADEILRVDGRKAAFVVAKIAGTKKYKMSARGINTNVQMIAEAVGGGGHFGTAAAETTEKLDLFIDNIKQAIVSVKDESNIN
ncbi:hypothetical protein FJO69_00460 [[Mycoplasma] falconis]|uniref:Cyclic-di-AMP phosphodiesterase n=1 Tax=[Mycoplasma] falconis TaxID=92403 RepID=A0A501XC57_9BACT|nr:DHH family phosphoesterase [[Mycoplasma] falconis]TPE58066.1 hypothetical protein FJO69_00460 [[Mycoplasma] falconis]